MHIVRRWATRHANAFEKLYDGFERILIHMHPMMQKVGYQRLEKPMATIERWVKGFFFDSQMCGFCTLGSTGMTCPMNCPKQMRNGPCGGVRPNGRCEINPRMACIWIDAYIGSQLMAEPVRILDLQAPVDYRLQNSSSWLREVRRKVGLE
jgi:hypothetical protein